MDNTSLIQKYGEPPQGITLLPNAPAPTGTVSSSWSNDSLVQKYGQPSTTVAPVNQKPQGALSSRWSTTSSESPWSQRTKPTFQWGTSPEDTQAKGGALQTFKDTIRPVANFAMNPLQTAENLAKIPVNALDLVKTQGLGKPDLENGISGGIGGEALDLAKTFTGYNIAKGISDPILGAVDIAMSKITGKAPQDERYANSAKDVANLFKPSVTDAQGKGYGPANWQIKLVDILYNLAQEHPEVIPIMAQTLANPSTATLNPIEQAKNIVQDPKRIASGEIPLGNDVISKVAKPFTSLAKDTISLVEKPIYNMAFNRRTKEFETAFNQSKSTMAKEVKFDKNSAKFATELEGEGVKLPLHRDARGKADWSEASDNVREVAQRDNVAMRRLLQSSGTSHDLDKIQSDWESAVRAEFKGTSQAKALEHVRSEMEAYKTQYANQGFEDVNGNFKLPSEFANDIKSDLWGKSKFTAITPENELINARTNYLGGKALMIDIENTVPDELVHQLNNRIGNLQSLTQTLDKANGGVVHGSFMRPLINRGVGAIVGATHGPVGAVAGAVTADAITYALSNPNISISKYILARAEAEVPEILNQVERQIGVSAQSILDRPKLEAPTTIYSQPTQEGMPYTPNQRVYQGDPIASQSENPSHLDMAQPTKNPNNISNINESLPQSGKNVKPPNFGLSIDDVSKDAQDIPIERITDAQGSSLDYVKSQAKMTKSGLEQFAKDGVEPDPEAFHGARLGRQVENPVEATVDEYGNYSITDGNHRLRQAIMNGDKTIKAIVTPEAPVKPPQFIQEGFQKNVENGVEYYDKLVKNGDLPADEIYKDVENKVYTPEHAKWAIDDAVNYFKRHGIDDVANKIEKALTPLKNNLTPDKLIEKVNSIFEEAPAMTGAKDMPKGNILPPIMETEALGKSFLPKAPIYAGEADLSTTILRDLEGRSTVSKQYILDATNRGNLKQVERDLIRDLVKNEGDNVNVADFAKKVKAELLPLDRVNSDKYKLTGTSYHDPSAMLEEGNFTPKYENVALPSELRGKVANYSENLYQSPIKTSAGDTHFGGVSNAPDRYFGHTRIEDMADNKTRRVIEVQSDLYQKGKFDELSNRVSNELGTGLNREGAIKEATDNPNSYAASQLKREAEMQKLAQYNDPTAHFRMIREEIKQAAVDGKTKLQFPTGETAMKIEGLGDTTQWNFRNAQGNIRTPEVSDLRVGMEIQQGNPTGHNAQDWIITDVLGDGKFKAVPKDTIMNMEEELAPLGYTSPDSIDFSDKKVQEALSHQYGGVEQFDISGKVDQNNPIYKFYEKDVQNYLRNKYNAKPVTDDKGVKWIEVQIKPEMKNQPVDAFSMRERSLV